jgi:hypothetical protein
MTCTSGTSFNQATTKLNKQQNRNTCQDSDKVSLFRDLRKLGTRSHCVGASEFVCNILVGVELLDRLDFHLN